MEINKKLIKSKWVSTVLILGIISTIINLYSNKNVNYRLVFLLPLSYSILNLLFKNMYEVPKYKYGLGFWSINIVMLCRYVITPIAIIFTNVYGRIGPDPSIESFTTAVIIMIYEMICVFLVLYITTNFLKSKKIRIDDNKNCFFNNNYIVISLFLVASLVILSPYPGSIIPKDLFVISTEGGTALKDFETNGIISAISEAFKLAVFLYLISLINKLFKKNENKIWPIISIVILLVFIGLKTSQSRWGLTLNAVVGTYIIIQLYPKFKKLTYLIIGSVVIISFISISLYKFYYLVGSDSNNQVIDVLGKMLTMFEDYFSGPRLVAQAVEMKKQFSSSISFNTFINGLLVPIPFLNKLADSVDLSNLYFNAYNLGYIGQQWLILPMVGEGYSLLGLIGAPLFTIICEGLAIFFDYMAVKNNKYEFKYILFYASIWCSLCLGFCTQIVFTWLAGSFLVIYILFVVNSKVYLKNRY